MRSWFRWRRRQQPEPPDEEGEGQTAERERSGWYLRFARQQLKGYSPILRGKAVVLYLVGVAVFLIALGIPILTASTGIVEYYVRYDDQGPLAQLSSAQREQQIQAATDNGVLVPITFQINKTMEPPIYMYYSLSTFHQNHKRYVRSRGDSQLGNDGNTTSTCQPYEYISGPSGNAVPGAPNGGAIDPCGLMAHSFFNDSYTASIDNGAGSLPLAIDDSLIAWTDDRDHLYRNYAPVNWNSDPATRGGTNTSATGTNAAVVNITENQHFMVWMRPAAQPTVRKLWGVIRQQLPRGSVVTVLVANRYNTYRFEGHKGVILTTNSWVGAKNTFLGIAYIVCAILSFVVAIIFFIAYHLGVGTKRTFGDINYLSWNRTQ